MVNETGLVSDEFARSLASVEATPAAQPAPSPTAYKPLFNYSSSTQADADPTGEYTQKIGAARGEVFSPGKVLEANLYGSVLPEEQLLQLEGGKELLGLLSRNRKGRRGFGEAVSTGPLTDFVPYLTDVASLGIGIKNMSKARDAMTKMREQGADALSLQEKVWLKTYEEDSVRQSQQTWGGLVGTIIRQAPAFALEFLTTGGMFKAGASLLKTGAKETIESAAEEFVRANVKSRMRDAAAAVGKEAAVTMDDDALRLLAKETALKHFPDPADAIKAEGALFKTAQLQYDAIQNPKKFQGTVDFFTEYTKRGFLEHMDLDHTVPPGIASKLREAAGVFFVDAPIKGALYGGFDFFVANPLAAKLAGGDEAVTKAELQFASSADPDIARNAKMMALGSAWMEYGSESSGRGFNALFGIVPEIAGEAGRRAARGALAAVTPKWFEQGAYVRKLLELDAGTPAEIAGAISDTKTLAARHFAATPAAMGKTVAEITTTPKLQEAALKSYLAKNEKSFFGFWLADKMTNQGWGPDTAGKWLRRAGYDDILGEFMEERYNGFAAGLFGFDGESDNPDRTAVMDHLSRAASGFFPPTWSQATAEIVAFALPSAGRAVINRGFAAVGAGPLGVVKTLADAMDSMSGRAVLSLGAAETAQDQAITPGENVKVMSVGEDADTAAANTAKRLGVLAKTPGGEFTPKELGEMAALVASKIDNLQQDHMGLGQRIASIALGMVNFALTGNPMLMFRNPVKEILSERMGSAAGTSLMAQLATVHSKLFNNELRSRTEATAAGVRGAQIGTVDAPNAAAAISDKLREEVEAAIRPQMVADATRIVKGHLFARGTMPVEESDLVKLVKDLREQYGDKIKGTDAEFIAKFRTELKEVAANRMSVQFYGDNAVWHLERPEMRDGNEMFAYVDRLMADFGVKSYLHVSDMKNNPHAVLDQMSGRPVPIATFRTVAGITGNGKSMTSDEWKAVNEIMYTMIPNPVYLSEAGMDKAVAKAKYLAKAFLALNKHLLLPSYGVAEQFARPAILKEGRLSHSLLGDNTTFESVEDMDKAAADAGLLRSAPTEVVFTPYNDYFSSNPAELAFMFKSYFTGGAHELNPFRTEADWATAMAKDIELRALAKETTSEGVLAKERVEKYDKAMIDALSAVGVKPINNPRDPSKTGYMLSASAMTSASGAKIYIPLKQAASVASAIEDHIEAAYKRNSGIFLISEPDADGVVRNVYRPAAKAAISLIKSELEKEYTTAVAKPERDRNLTEKQYIKQVEVLQGIFNPEKVNIEAVSKAINGIIFYMGDNAVRGIGGSTTEAALYRPLGNIAKSVREIPRWENFMSLASRLSGTGQLSASNRDAFAGFVGSLIPEGFLNDMGATSIKPENALGHIKTRAEALEGEITAATKAISEEAGMKDAYAALDPTNAYLPEDMPAVVDMLRQSLARGGDVAAVEPLPPVSRAAEEIQVPLKSGTPVQDELPGLNSASLAESLSDPAQAAALAKFAQVAITKPSLLKVLGLPVKAKVALPGDKDYLDETFAFWKAVAPDMPASTFDSYKAAYDKATKKPVGLFAKIGEVLSDLGQKFMEYFDIDDNEAVTPDKDIEDRIDHFADDGIREAFGRNAGVRLFDSVMGGIYNPAGAGSVVRHRMDLVHDSQSALGDYAPGSIAALLSGKDGETVHPALVRETFDAWVSGPHAEKSIRSQAFLALLEALGFEESLRLLTTIRGATAVAGVTLDAEENTFRVSERSAQPSDSLRLFLRGRSAAEVAKAADAIRAVFSQRAKADLPLDPQARLTEVTARATELAGLAELLFGEGNLLTSALNDFGTQVRLSRHGRKSDKVSFADMWLSGYKGYAGLLTQRLLDAANEFTASKDANKAVDALFDDGIKVGNPSLRGAVGQILNMFAASVPMGQVRTTDGEAKVSLVSPAKSETMYRLLGSDEFRDVALAFFGTDKDSFKLLPAATKALIRRQVADMREFAVWPDGSQIFANVAGATYGGQEVGEVDVTEVARILEASYSDKSAYAMYQLYAGDKSHPLLISIPKSLSHLVTKTVGPLSYNAVYRAVATLAGMDAMDNKRVNAVTMGYGAVVPVAPKVRFALVIPEGKVSKEVRGAGYGQLMVSGKTFVDNVRTMHDLATMKEVKAHITDAERQSEGQTLFAKGVQEIVSEADLSDPNITESRKALIKLHLAEEASGAAETTLSFDLDAAKELIVNSKFSGVSVDGKVVPFAEYLSERAEVTADTEVMWKGARDAEPRLRKLSEVIPGLVIRRNVATGDGGKPALVISYDAQARFQIAAFLHHSAFSEAVPMQRNQGREGNAETVGNIQELLSLGYELALVHNEAYPDTDPVEFRDSALGAMVAEGTLPLTSDMAATAIAPTLSRRELVKAPMVRRVLMLNKGDWDITFNGQAERPYGKAHELSHERGTMSVNGKDVMVPASVAMNIKDPLFRYGMYADETNEAFKADPSQAGIARVIRERLHTLDAYRNAHNTPGFVAYLTESVMPLFTDTEGNKFEGGRVFSFDDLFVPTSGGGRVFDDTAIYSGERAPGDRSRVFLNGGSVILGRTPSGNDGMAYALVRVYGPSTVNADESVSKVAVATQQASGLWKISVTDSKQASGQVDDEAIVTDTAGITKQTGNDHDGDEMNALVYGLDPNGVAWRYADASHLTPEIRERMLREVTDADPEKAKRALSVIHRDLGNSIRAQQELWLRGLDYENLGSVSASPVSDEAKLALDKLYPVQKLDKLDSMGAALLTKQGTETAKARGSAVHTVGIMHAIHLAYGVTAKASFGAVLTDARGEKISGMPDADFTVPLTAAEWHGVNGFADRWSNAFFDGLKGDGIAQRYGMDRNLINIHYFLLMSSKITTQDAYDAFMMKWAAWAHGPQGQAILAHAANAEPGYTGEFGKDPVAALHPEGKAALEDALADVDGYAALDYNDRQAALAVAASYATYPAEAASRVAGLVKLFGFIKTSRALMRITELPHSSFPTVTEIDKLARQAESAASTLDKDSDLLLGRNKGVLKARLRQASGMIARAYKAFEGTYEASPLVTSIAEVIDPEGKASTTSVSWARKLRKPVSARKLFNYLGVGVVGVPEKSVVPGVMPAIYANAAIAYTPAEVGAKIDAVTGVSASGRTLKFLTSAESLYRKMFKAYAADKGMRNSVSVFHQLIAPFEGPTNDVPAIMPASIGDAEYNLPALTRGLEQLRNWPASDTRLDVEENGVKFTPADMWHVLRIYATLTAPVSHKVTRGNRSFLPAFGNDVLRAYAKYQMAAFVPKTPESGLAYLVGARNIQVTLRPRAFAPDALFYKAPWGTAASATTDELVKAQGAARGPVAVETSASAVTPDVAFNPTTFGEASAVLESRDTILSNSEALVLAKKLDITPGGAMPRILTASERTDPVWYADRVKKLVASGRYDAVYLVTKHDGLPMRELLQMPIPKIIHFSMTTLGGTAWEPGVMKWQDLMSRIEDFIKQGLSPDDITIRIDPIVPGVTKSSDIEAVLRRVVTAGITRVRFSVMDGYSGAIESKIRSLYPTEKLNAFYERVGKNMEAKQSVVDAIATKFVALAKSLGFSEVGSCAEKVNVPGVIKEGCLPVAAVEKLVGRQVDDSKSKQRPLCLCFGGKVDGFKYDDTCPSSCVYCYARHGSDTANKYYGADGKLLDNPLTRTHLQAAPAIAQVVKRDESVIAAAVAKAAEVAESDKPFVAVPKARQPDPAAVVAAQQGFRGYKGGFENTGKGTPRGDGKDKAMRKVMTSAKVPGFIGEIWNSGKFSSTRTSLLEAASYGSGGNVTSVDKVTHSSLPMFVGSGTYAPGEFVVMLARNGEFNGKPLSDATKSRIDKAGNAGAEFVTGDMPGVDSAFVDYLQEKRYPFTVYHTGSKSRIDVAVQPGSAAQILGTDTKAEQALYAMHALAAMKHSLSVLVAYYGRPLGVVWGQTKAGVEEAAKAAAHLMTMRDAHGMSDAPYAANGLTAAASVLRHLGHPDTGVIKGTLLLVRDALNAAGTEKSLATAAALPSSKLEAGTDSRRLAQIVGRPEFMFSDRLTDVERVLTYGLIYSGTVTLEPGVEITAVAKKTAERMGLPAVRPVRASDVDTPAAVAAKVEDVSASLAEDSVQSDLGISDEELQAYMEHEKSGKFYAAETLQDKFQKRLKALIPPMPDEFYDSDNDEQYRLEGGKWSVYNFGTGAGERVSSDSAKSKWEQLQRRNQTGSFATVAQAIEDWKRDEGIVYDPNDAYSRGEGFYHDIGAFNPSAPGLIGGIAKVLLAQEKKRRAGDLRYWEDTANQLVVSAYTTRADAVSFENLPDGHIISVDQWGTYVKVNGEWYESFINGISKTPVDQQELDALVGEYGVSLSTRPGSGLRFVIRPSAQNILWAAKGDVYSGTAQEEITTPGFGDANFSYGGHDYLLVEETRDPDTLKWLPRRFTEDGRDISETAYAAAFEKAARAVAKLHVDAKAPAATKLGLLSTTLAGAIEDRRPQNYNELGVRLALGNFYIEGDNLPKELRRLNEHLKKAFIRVHGSLDPVAPYAPKTINRAAGEVTAAITIYDTAYGFYAKGGKETREEEVRQYKKELAKTGDFALEGEQRQWVEKLLADAEYSLIFMKALIVARRDADISDNSTEVPVGFIPPKRKGAYAATYGRDAGPFTKVISSNEEDPFEGYSPNWSEPGIEERMPGMGEDNLREKADFAARQRLGAPTGMVSASLSETPVANAIFKVIGTESIGGNAGFNRAGVNFLFDPDTGKVVFWGNFQESGPAMVAAYHAGKLKSAVMMIDDPLGKGTILSIDVEGNPFNLEVSKGGYPPNMAALIGRSYREADALMAGQAVAAPVIRRAKTLAVSDAAVAAQIKRINDYELAFDWTKDPRIKGDKRWLEGQLTAQRSAVAEYIRELNLRGGRLAFLAMDADLRKLLSGLRDGDQLGGVGKSAADMLEGHLFTADALKDPIWFENDSNYKNAMIKMHNSEHLLRQTLDSLMGADAATDERVKAIRVALSRAMSRAESWVVASHSPLMSKAVALDNAEGDITATPARLKAVGRYLPVGMGEINPETLDADAWDQFKVTFADSDVWFEGSVLPFFRGQGLRDILLQKAALAGLPQAFGTGNFLTSLLGVGSDKGTLLRMTKIAGAPMKADGRGGYEMVAEEDRAMVDKFERPTLSKDLRRDSYTPDELALARFMSSAINAYVGDGGSAAKLPLSGSIEFHDLPKDRIEVSFKAAMSRLSRLSVDDNGRAIRPYAVDVLMARAKNNVPAALFPAVEAAIQAGYETYFKSPAMSPYAREMEAIEAMRTAGFANRRLKTGERGEVSLVSSVLTLPVSEIAKTFAGSTAHAKLLKAGRVKEDLTLEACAKLVRESHRNVDLAARHNMSGIMTDLAPMHAAGMTNPFWRGNGFFSYLARKEQRAPLPEYTEKMRQLYTELLDTSRSCFEGGVPVSLDKAATRGRRMLQFYADLFLKDGEPAKTNMEALLLDLSEGGSRSLGRNPTMWDLATEIYKESARRIHETAARNGTVEDTVLGDVPLYVFNAAIDAAAEENQAAERRQGMTWTEIYEVDGALPRNMGADEAVSIHAQEVSTAVRARMAMNQALLAADERGMPLVYANPGDNADDTVPDRMWGIIARWWSEVHGLPYDESKSGKKNAQEMYSEIVKGKITVEGVAQTAGAVRQYVFKKVDVPPGMASFTSIVAAADTPGDDSKGALSAWTGGEAANIMTQILAIPGYGHRGAALAGVNRVLSWSKSLSVMASLFFPIATAFESPWAAVGGATTVLGLTRRSSELARKLASGTGPAAAALKKLGVDHNAPFMADIIRLIGSNDPALTDLKTHAILAGIQLADRSKNMTDHDRKVLSQDIKRLSELASGIWGHKGGKAVRVLLEGALEESSELAFEYIINATKISVFAQMNNRLRAEAAKAGRWWDPIRDMKKWAAYINAEVGGIDPAMYAFATPKALQVAKTAMFSWEWTLGAWEAGGGGVITRKLFGGGTSPQTRGFMFGRWWRMGMGVMIGIPMLMQLIATAFGKVAGDDKEKKGDRWWTWQNEKGKEFSDFDITPFLRSMGKAPYLADFKRAHPVLGGLIPALTGEEGEMTSSRKRRYYMHFGKQGWEVAGWFEDPVKSMLGKLSMPVQRVMEGVLGITPSMGWEKDFKDLGFWERWTNLTPGKSASLGLLGAFVPFSLSGTARSPEAGFLNAVGPIGKGMSKTRAEKEMARMFQEWGDDESFAGKMRGRKGAWTELQQMGDQWLEALALNGYDPKTSLKQAIAAARKPLYERVHKALPTYPGDKVDRKELEAASRGLYRLDFIAKDMLKSIKARDKRQNIKRVDDMAKITDEGIRSAFLHPYGDQSDPRLRRSAELGGDVVSLLASDKVPNTMLGYRVLTTEELSEDDLKFFADNPSSAGHFEMNYKGAKI